MTFLGVACDDWGGPCDQIFCSYWSSFERHDDHMIWSGNGRYCVIDMVEFEVTDSLWLRNSHLKWYWEGILEYMWIIQYLRQLRLSDEWYWCNDRLRIGRTVDDICERIGILLILWKFWTRLSSDINDLEVGKLMSTFHLIRNDIGST